MLLIVYTLGEENFRRGNFRKSNLTGIFRGRNFFDKFRGIRRKLHHTTWMTLTGECLEPPVRFDKAKP